MSENKHISSTHFNFKLPIVLTGMMGSGKTTAGKILADKMQIDFYDSDALIESSGQRDIHSYFESEKEDIFRDLEESIITDIIERHYISKSPCILSTGGGAVLRQSTRQVLKLKSISIHFDAPASLLWERLKEDSSRPLLKTQAPKETLENLLNQRRPYYEQAHISLAVKEEDVEETCIRLIKALSAYQTDCKT